MIKEITIEEFQNSGMLWLINTTLHIFGMAIVAEYDENGKPVRIYPARVKFRGFSEECNTRGYKRVSEYMNNNLAELLKECNE